MMNTLRGMNFVLQVAFLALVALVNVIFWGADTAAVVASAALGLFFINVVVLKAIGLYLAVTRLPADSPPVVNNITTEDIGG